MTKADAVIARMCSALGRGDEPSVLSMLTEEYPFQFKEKKTRKCGDKEKLKVYIRDGFIDRYSGRKLVFTPVLRVLSKRFPKDFPFHLHWKMEECHIAYWELAPTIDHVIPVARGGKDEERNWVCTSQLRNSAKANWLLEELGWELHPAGNLEEWDGLLQWYVEYINGNEDDKRDPYLMKWYALARNEIKT